MNLRSFLPIEQESTISVIVADSQNSRTIFEGRYTFVWAFLFLLLFLKKKRAKKSFCTSFSAMAASILAYLISKD